MLPEPPSVRAWNATAHAAAEVFASAELGEGEAAEAQERIQRCLARRRALRGAAHAELIAAGKLVCVLGGDHSVRWGRSRSTSRAIPIWASCTSMRTPICGAPIRLCAVARVDHVQRRHRSAGLARLVQVGVRDLCDEEASRIEASSGRILTFSTRSCRRKSRRACRLHGCASASSRRCRSMSMSA